MTAKEIAQALVITAEVIGHELSPAAAEAMARTLVTMDHDKVLAALSRCRMELSGRLTLAAILQRVDDAHLGAEEAWALCPRSEAETVVWTEEIDRAFNATSSLDDQVSARMTFKETYTRLLGEARAERRPAEWYVSFGHDRGLRVAPVRRAYELGRLSKLAALLALDDASLPERDAFIASLPGGDKAKALPAEQKALPPKADGPVIVADDVKALLKQLKGGERQASAEQALERCRADMRAVKREGGLT